MRKSLALLASAALMGLTLAAHADTFTYSFTGTDGIANFNFTSTTTITASENLLTSATISSLTCIIGGVTCKTFSAGVNAALGNVLSASSGLTSISLGISSFSPGIYNLTSPQVHGNGTFTVTDNAPAVAATPEPSSLVLLGTGLLGFAGAARRRFLNA